MRDELNGWRRIAFGFVADVALAIYVIPGREHLFDIRDYQYVQLDMRWDLVIATIPLVVLLVLLPVVIHGNLQCRWSAIALSIFPAYVAITVWIQLICR